MPGTNKRVRRIRPKEQWSITDQPELRIIDDALWQKVQARLEWVKETYAAAARDYSPAQPRARIS